MANKPLAYRMRPKTLNEVIGQKPLLDFLGKLKESNNLLSMIFYGKPGVGKTTIAKAFANSFNSYSVTLNAVLDNKAKMEQAFDEAIRFNPSIVIIDEIHRLDKGKQDLLLPHLENGDFYLIGCTTANPLISINPAIRSRCRLLELPPLTSDDVYLGLKRAVSSPDGLNSTRVFADEAIRYLAKISAGDLRFAYNQLEAVALSYSSDHLISLADMKAIANVPNYYADLDGDEHYNTVSAFQKSIRGSDVNAAIYYLAKILKSGDLEGLVRRLLVTAYEDVGLANPQAVDRCYHACQVAREVGLPEAEIPLAFTVVDLSLSPKSKSATWAIEAADAKVDESPIQVQNYLKLKQVGVQPEDAYPYDDPRIWKYLQYLPDSLKDTKFFNAWSNGRYEIALNENYQKLQKIDRQSSVKDARIKAHTDDNNQNR